MGIPSLLSLAKAKYQSRRMAVPILKRCQNVNSRRIKCRSLKHDGTNPPLNVHRIDQALVHFEHRMGDHPHTQAL
jgi:hypothetical protein